MAVGIDYSLFYLRREREERARGADTATALRRAAATSGRAIVVSGLTVMIALAGLFLTGYSVFTGVAIGTIAVVGVAVAGSLTALPALLSWLGPWADRGRVPFLGRRAAAARPSRLWAALVRRVVAHPVVWGSVAALAMIVLAVPALGLRLGSPQDGGFSAKVPAVAALNRFERVFPGRPGPAQVVVTGRGLAGSQVAGALTALEGRATAHGPIRGPITAAPVADGRALLVSVPLAGNGVDAVSDHALLTLRDRVLPRTLGQVRGISYAVAGNTAENYDDIAVLRTRTPLVLGVVALLAFALLLVAFRSVAIPLVSITLNLLSVGAAYGLITYVFQDGHGAGLLGFTSYGAIVPWIPLFIFVFLFGLSMDYHVFILSRIRELRARGRAREAQHRRGSERHREQRGRGDQRGSDHGGGVLDLRDAAPHPAADAGRGPGRRGADRRHGGPRHPAARLPGPARRADLVPAALAGLAAWRGSGGWCAGPGRPGSRPARAG